MFDNEVHLFATSGYRNLEHAPDNEYRHLAQMAPLELITFWEDLNSINSGAHRGIKPCYHISTKCNRYPIRATFVPSSGYATVVMTKADGTDWHNRARTIENHPEFASLVPDWDSAMVNHFGARNSSNLINFGLEIDDVANTFGSIANAVHGLSQRFTQRAIRAPGAAVNALRSRRLLRHATARDLEILGTDANAVASAGAQVTLANNFGLVPLLGDGINWGQRFSNIDHSYRRLNEMSQRDQRIRGTQNKMVTGTMPFDRTDVYGNDYELEYSAVQTLTTGFTRSADGQRPVVSSFQNGMDTLGLYPDLGTVWEAIPFSFLVDYAVPIGDALTGVVNPLDTSRRGYSWSTPSNPGEIRDAWCTRRTTINWKARVKRLGDQMEETYPPTDRSKFPMLIADGTTVIYNRQPAVPYFDGVDVSTPSSLSLGENQRNNSLSLLQGFGSDANTRLNRRNTRRR
jgi:hypothetical protein